MQDNEDRSVFISYTADQLDFADQIAAGLRRVGIEPWIDREQLVVGESFPAQIVEGIQSADAYVVIVGDDDQSHGRMFEWSAVVSEVYEHPQRAIVPVVVNHAVVPAAFYGRQIVDVEEQSRTQIYVDSVVNAVVTGFDFGTVVQPVTTNMLRHSEVLERWNERTDDLLVTFEALRVEDGLI